MPDELYRVEFRGALAGQYRENVMHWRIQGATNDTPFENANDLNVFLDANVRPVWLAACPDDYSLEAIITRRLGPTTGNYASVDYQSLQQPGNRTGPSVSEQLCPCITLIPPMGVKSGGRIFLPAVAKGDVNLNQYLASYVTAVNTLMSVMSVGGTVAGGAATLCIFSRKLNTSAPVISYHLSPVIGYQRRRSHPVGS